LTKNKPITEPSGLYEEYRGRAVREADRYLFLAVSNYRRALDLLTPSSAYWSWITLYYGAYYAASAILGFLGVNIEERYVLIDVLETNPNHQEVVVRKYPKHGPTLLKAGGHRMFWDFYYTFSKSIENEVPPSLRPFVNPTGTRDWQTNSRNHQNYDSFTAFETCGDFRRGFRRDRFPTCLSADFLSQHNLTKGTIDLGLHLAHELKVTTDVVDVLHPTGDRKEKYEVAIRGVRSPFSPSRELFAPSASRRAALAIHV